MADSKVPATVRRVWQETDGLTGVVLEVPSEIAAAYERPGQVVVLHTEGGDKIYIALASGPGEAQGLELLLGEAAVAKVAPEEGQHIDMDPPMGRGFPLEMAEGRDVLLFAVGSALAPIRSLIHVLRAHRKKYGRVVLFVGAHTEAAFPYRGEFDAWRADDIEIVQSVSRPWVQERFSEMAPALDNAVAYVCGMKEMMEDVTRALTEAGLPRDRIGRNW